MRVHSKYDYLNESELSTYSRYSLCRSFLSYSFFIVWKSCTSNKWHCFVAPVRRCSTFFIFLCIFHLVGFHVSCFAEFKFETAKNCAFRFLPPDLGNVTSLYKWSLSRCYNVSSSILSAFIWYFFIFILDFR